MSDFVRCNYLTILTPHITCMLLHIHAMSKKGYENEVQSTTLLLYHTRRWNTTGMIWEILQFKEIVIYPSLDAYYSVISHVTVYFIVVVAKVM